MSQNNYLSNILPNRQPQNQGNRLKNRTDEIQNSSGAYVFAVDDFTRLTRFLILGSEGGSYYATERDLTKQNFDAVIRAIKEDGKRAVDEIVAVSEGGRAPKNDPALFALALAITHGDVATRNYAAESLPRVARIGTHLFHFAEYADGMRGWGKGLRKAISNWYTNLNQSASALSDEAIEAAVRRADENTVQKLAYQTVKYVQREGWSHRDLLRLAHVQAKEQYVTRTGKVTGLSGVPGTLGKVSDLHNSLFHYIVNGWPNVGDEPHSDKAMQIVWAAERAKTDISEKELVNLIETYRLPMETIPTNKRSKAVYESVLQHGAGMTWILRNLGNLAKNGIIATGQYNDHLKLVVEKLTNETEVQKARLHPLQILVARNTFALGHGVKGNSTWNPVQDVIDALDQTFYLSFDFVVPTNKRFVLGLDVSPSMFGGYGGASMAGAPGVTPAVGAGVMAMATKRIESYAAIMGFTSNFVDLGIGRNDTLDNVQRKMNNRDWGSTDCSLPFEWAMKNKVEADVFVVYTDNETNNYGKAKPVIALREYRQKMGIDAKLVVVGMVSNGFTIADPTDAGMMDVVGFDTSAPAIIAEFAKGNL